MASIARLGNRLKAGQPWPELPSEITIPHVSRRTKKKKTPWKKDIKRERKDYAAIYGMKRNNEENIVR